MSTIWEPDLDLQLLQDTPLSLRSKTTDYLWHSTSGSSWAPRSRFFWEIYKYVGQSAHEWRGYDSWLYATVSNYVRMGFEVWVKNIYWAFRFIILGTIYQQYISMLVLTPRLHKALCMYVCVNWRPNHFYGNLCDLCLQNFSFCFVYLVQNLSVENMNFCGRFWTNHMYSMRQEDSITMVSITQLT